MNAYCNNDNFNYTPDNNNNLYQPAPVQTPKKKNGSGKIVAMALCFSLLGGALGTGGTYLALHNSNSSSSAVSTQSSSQTEKEPAILNSTEKTENAIQNIILENMEKFEGILIATTNLALNLDAAFERRFLFKIKFDNPSVQAKTAIWQSKLSWLQKGQAAELAERYEFSGGEIDNVVRKAAMEEILTGTQVSMDELEKLLSKE